MTDVSAGFWPPCWCPSRWAPAWRLHTSLYKFGKNVSPHIFGKKNCCDLNLGESLYISTFFLFPDSRLNRLHGFHFYFDLFWMAWHWKPAIFRNWLNWKTLQTNNLNLRCERNAHLKCSKSPSQFTLRLWLRETRSRKKSHSSVTLLFKNVDKLRKEAGRVQLRETTALATILLRWE